LRKISEKSLSIRLQKIKKKERKFENFNMTKTKEIKKLPTGKA